MRNSSSSVIDRLRGPMVADRELARWCVAFSGGLDSTVLLHALERLRHELDGIELRVVHIDHGIHSDSAAWAEQSARFAASLSVPFECRRVEVDRNSGLGIEAAARTARYAAFEALLSAHEALLTAHHADDQVETLLLRLLRGAGVRGLGSIAERTRFGRGWLLRPLLMVARAELATYAREYGLEWIEDPTNRDTSLDRNYLRHEIVPLLRRRWPGADAAIGRSARLAAEASALLDDVARRDCAAVLDGGLIAVDALRSLAPARQRNVIRTVLFDRGMPPPSEARLAAGLEQLLTARDDRHPILDWGGGQIRRYRGRLYVLATDPDRATAGDPDEYRWDGLAPLEMGPVRGRLRGEGGDPAALLPGNLQVRFRRGGERLLAADQAHHERLKKVLQARGVLPWMRAHVPLVYHRGELVAVGDLWRSAALAQHLGASWHLRWEGHADVA